MKMKNKGLWRLCACFLIIFASCVSAVSAQQAALTVTGKVTDVANGEPLEFAQVELRTTEGHKLVANGTVKADGSYTIAVPAEGKYYLKASFMGYEPAYKHDINLEAGQTYTFSFKLSETAVTLNEVVVKGLSEGERVQRLAYNVSMMETGKLKNTTLDLAHMIDRISGVKIRENGGLGADANISLGGFSGRHVKVFIDGVPMEGMSSAFGLNNIPVGLAKRVEVYKGVVPIELGGDALGGAINIVTDEEQRTRVNASYSYGSFNTHRTNLFGEWRARNGFYISLNAYQNYSDNDYKVNVSTITHYEDDGSSWVEEGDFTVRRFHAKYHNEAAVLKVGVVDKSWADRLLLGFIGGYEYKQTQTGSSMDFVYGGRYNTATTLTPSLTYEKRFDVLKGLHVSLNGNYNFGTSYAADTAARKYNWLGEWKPMPSKGESSYMKYRYRDRNGAANMRVTLFPAEHHSLSFSTTFTTFSRKGKDETVIPYGENDYPKESRKTVSGLSYKYDFRDIWNTSFFVKNYVNHLEAYVDPDGEFGPETTQFYTNTKSYWGGGLATTVFVGKHVQLKASYEHAYRLPTSSEMFGSADGLEVGQANLKPEQSDNYNLGVTANPIDNAVHRLTLDASFQYRNVNDYIRRSISQTKGTASSENSGKVRSFGADFGVRYTFRDLFFVGGNFSYIDMRNMSRYKAGTQSESTVYKDRMPNQPYMYGNADAGVSLRDIFFKGTLLDIHYMLNYIHEFDYDWESYNGDIVIPRQVSHDIYVTYNFGKRREFTFTAECRNLLDERLYDNFRMQKPGRSFAFKIGYNFSK